jgi:hypothetical protein
LRGTPAATARSLSATAVGAVPTAGAVTAALLTTLLAAVDNHDLGGLVLLLVVVVVFGEEESRAGVGEGGEWRRALDHLGLIAKFAPESSQELHGEVMIGHQIADVGEVVGDGLKAVGVGGDPHVAAWRVLEDLAEIYITGGPVSKEEVVEARPCGGGAAVGAKDKAVQIISEGLHEA